MHVTLVSGIDPATPSASGTRQYVLGLADGLRRRDIGVSLVARNGGPLPIPDVDHLRIHTGPSSARFLLRLVASAPGLPIPSDSIIHAQRPDDLVAFLFAKRRNPKVCTLHGIPAIGVRRRKGRTYGAAYRLLERSGLKRTDRVIAVDGATRRWYADRYPWLDRRATVVPVAVDTTKFRPMDRADARARYGVTARYSIVFAGRLTPEKRVDTLIRGIPPEAQLLVAGSGPQEGPLRSLAKSLPVTFLGSVPHEDMPVLLNAADLVVLASEYEGMPTIVLEALASGTPVVATPVGGVPEVVVPGVSGWLVQDTTAFGGVLRDALPLAGALRDQCVEIARPYSWEVVIDRILAVYREAAA